MSRHLSRIIITGPLHVADTGAVCGRFTYIVSTPDRAIVLPVVGDAPADAHFLQRLGLLWVRNLLATRILRQARRARR